MHGEGSSPAHRFNDQSANAQKARNYLPHLQRYGKVSGIVEYVANGSRCRLSLPENGSSISFGLSGVRCPNSARGDEPGEPYGNEAAFFSKSFALQRDVTIQVDAADRGGSFLGSLWVDGQSLGVELLRQGLGWCSDSVHNNPYAQQMESAEQGAKNQKLGVWENYDPEAERRAAEARAAADEAATPAIVQISVQHVENGNTFFCHMLGDTAKALIQRRAASFAQSDFGPPSAGNRFRTNQYCSAEYKDGSMYRAKVLQHDRESGYYHVQFIDYGNSIWAKGEQLQAWSSQQAGMSEPPKAFECKLAYVKLPTDEDFAYDAGAYLGGSLSPLGSDRVLSAQVVGKSADTYHLLLFDENNVCINAECLKNGTTMLTKDAKRNRNPSKELKELFSALEHAKRSRKGMWCNGDCESDDEDGGAWGTRR